MPLAARRALLTLPLRRLSVTLFTKRPTSAALALQRCTVNDESKHACTVHDSRDWIACVARVKVVRDSAEVKLQKFTLATDAGLVVSPDGGRAQVEGAALWGASVALHEGTGSRTPRGATPTSAPIRPCTCDVPELEVTFIDSRETSVGLGEPATTVVVPSPR
ncbi:MAG: molybdopterin cofactor-binding domain-containing protein [Pseudomonadota bacterium]